MHRTLLVTMLVFTGTFATVGAPLRAAPPALPAEALGDDVVGVLYLDALRIDRAKLAAAVDKAFGKHARAVHEALSPWKQQHVEFVRAGGTAMAFIYIDPAAAAGVANPVYLFAHKPDADAGAIRALIEKAGGKFAQIEKVGGWLAAYDRRLALPWLEKGKAERLEVFRDALAPIAEHPAVLAFVPTQRLQVTVRQRAGLDPDAPPRLSDFVRELVMCRSLSVAAAADGALHAALVMPDDQHADELLAMRKPMVDEAAPLVERAARGELSDIRTDLVGQVFAYHAVLSHAPLKRQGRRIITTLDGDALAAAGGQIAEGVVRMHDQAMSLRSAHHMRVLAVSLLAYARDHDGQFPASLDELGKLRFVEEFDKLLVNPRTGDNPGYVYVRPRQNLRDIVKAKLTGRTPILFESRDGQIDRQGLIGYLDGSVRQAGK